MLVRCVFLGSGGRAWLLAMEVDGVSSPAQQTMPVAEQTSADMKLDKVTAALTAQKDDIWAVGTHMKNLAHQFSVMEGRQSKADEATQSLQNTLMAPNVDSLVAALEAAVRGAWLRWSSCGELRWRGRSAGEHGGAPTAGLGHAPASASSSAGKQPRFLPDVGLRARRRGHFAVRRKASTRLRGVGRRLPAQAAGAHALPRCRRVGLCIFGKAFAGRYRVLARDMQTDYRVVFHGPADSNKFLFENRTKIGTGVGAGGAGVACPPAARCPGTSQG